MIAAGLLPAALLVWNGLTDGLGANPIEAITHETGSWALRFLLVTLAVTPARRLGFRRVASYRRTTGLLCFFYACLHASTWIGLDLQFDWALIGEDLLERPFITAGATAFLCLLPLAITSTRGWVRRLGRRWTQLHRLVYVAATAAVVHFIWLVKADLREPLIYAAVLVVLLGARIYFVAARRVRRRAATARAA